jgi:hypothetical protein
MSYCQCQDCILSLVIHAPALDLPSRMALDELHYHEELEQAHILQLPSPASILKPSLPFSFAIT